MKTSERRKTLQPYKTPSKPNSTLVQRPLHNSKTTQRGSTRMKKSNAPKGGIEETYKGIEMRSLLETRIAKLLDELDIEWEYEPKRYPVDKEQSYLPDFYLKNQDLYLEAKGVYSPEDEEIMRKFVANRDKDLLLMKSTKGIFIRKPPQTKETEDSAITLIECSKCGEKCFVPQYGSWNCRKCDNHNGDRDIVKYDIFEQTDDHKHSKIPALFIKDKKNVEEWVEIVNEEKRDIGAV